MARAPRRPDLRSDPQAPAFVAWLASLDPYEELTVRLALRSIHEHLSTDPVFGDRIKTLLTLLDPNPQETAGIMRRARELEKGGESKAGDAGDGADEPTPKPR